MKLIVLAIVFGALLFLSSAAVLALESSTDESGIGRLPLYVVALLHAIAGFFYLGGAAAWRARQWNVAAGAALAALLATAIGAVAAFVLAAKVQIAMPPQVAASVLLVCMAAGGAGLLLVAQSARRFRVGQ